MDGLELGHSSACSVHRGASTSELSEPPRGAAVDLSTKGGGCNGVNPIGSVNVSQTLTGASGGSTVFPGPGNPERSHQIPEPSSGPGESLFPAPLRHLNSAPIA